MKQPLNRKRELFEFHIIFLILLSLSQYQQVAEKVNEQRGNERQKLKSELIHKWDNRLLKLYVESIHKTST